MAAAAGGAQWQRTVPRLARRRAALVRSRRVPSATTHPASALFSKTSPRLPMSKPEVACPACRRVLYFRGASSQRACVCGACGAIFHTNRQGQRGGGEGASASSSQAGGAGSGNPSLSADPIVASSPNVLLVAGLLVLIFGYLQQIASIVALCTLWGAYMFNPIHDQGVMAEGWRLLRERRTALLDLRDKKDLKNWKVFKVLKNAVVDTVHAWQGQKVAVNFVFFTLAYVESEAPVDRELSAVGVMGTWVVLETSAFRDFAARMLQQTETLLRGETTYTQG